ncbi:MAG TPA: hypothetical protein VM261_21125 [Kofleriaceae bacterium]|nr:hypothetical protein [Kofleriaceae bacterium]
MDLLRAVPLVRLLIAVGLVTATVAACGGGGGGGDDDDPGLDADVDAEQNLPDCADSRDNDGDGKTDYPFDPGCLVPNQDSETDDCPSGPNCPECGDGRDNDFDGMTDYGGNDDDCTSAADDSELDIGSGVCGAGTSVLPLPALGMVSGTLGTGISNLMPVRCTGAVGTGTEAVYVITVSERETLVATTVDPSTTADTVLYLRRACMNTTTELACNNDVSPTNTDSTLTVSVDPGTYFLVVDARGPASSGGYVLRVTRHPAIGEACALETDCAPDHLCRIPAGGTTASCELPVCGDGRDDDGDTDIDFPGDPGCQSPTDNDEVDTCPGAGCPACANGLDDDGDGQTDYPMDTNCASAGAQSEFSCTTGDPVRLFTGNVTGQTTNALANDLQLTCGTNGRDEVWLLRVTAALDEVFIDTVGSTIDTAVALRRASCNGFDLQCDDDQAGSGDSSLHLVDLPVGDYYIVVDDKNTNGTYNLNVRGIWADGAACDPASTAFRCADGYRCTGTVPGATCTPVACNDTIDEDGDGLPGFPSDPGCATAGDDDESDACFPTPGAGCPVCANDLDDDGDTFIDYGNDPGCTFAGQNSELAPCTSFDPVLQFTSNLSGVSTIGTRLNDVQLSCGTNGRDEIYRLTVSSPLSNLRIDTVGSPLDTAVALRVATCNGTDVACDDDTAGSGDSLLNLANVSVGEYFIVVEAETTGNYNLNVRGTLQVHARCSPTSNLYFCPTAHACIGAPGAETCEPAACNDPIDQDGDGLPGYPSDPGCSDVSDPDESDDCPAGASCPACGNDIDDDGDGWIDYPQDPGCLAASDTSEIQCTSMDAIVPAAPSLVGVTTNGRANDFALSCGTNGRDEVYRFILDRPLSQLRVDTVGSTLDTVVAIRRSDCASSDLVCNDNGPGAGNASIATLNNPTAGEYYIIVDDRNSTSTPYNLNIRGVLPTGAACAPNDPLYVCAEAYRCAGTAGAETCIPGVCNDTVDEDGDGFPGFPTDPGCTSIVDADESDTCPSGPGCPICSDDLDNDNDGFTDYPLDPTCASASDNVEAAVCNSADPILTFSQNVSGASVFPRLNDITLSCGANGRDEVYRLVVSRPLASLTLDTIGSALDTVLGIRRTSCNGTDLACNDDGAGNLDSIITLSNVTPGEYFVIVDDRNAANNPYELHIRGELFRGSACTPSSQVFVCPNGSTCAGATGAETCVPSACNDTIDADGDGAAGYPDDPGCVDVNDNDETDACPNGAGCPVCGNDIDDDNDSRIDYPLDFGCTSASATSEVACPIETDPINLISGPVTTGSTTGAANTFTPTCRSVNGPDVVLGLSLPVPVMALHMDTIGSGFDTVLSLMDIGCMTSLACNDDGAPVSLRSQLDLSNIASGNYAVVMDSAQVNTAGAFTLNVRGTVAAGTACTAPQFATGLLVCPVGTACTAGVCQ